MTIKLSLLTTAVMGLSASLPVVAQESAELVPENGYGGHLKATITQTDNARKLEETRIEERQDELEGGFFANYENSLIRFDADYNAPGTNYNEDSQESRNILEGDASLRIGKDKDVIDLLLSQSQRAQYGSPDDAALDENLDDRTISSATPTLRARLSDVDTLALEGTYSIVEYRTNELRNSNRTGGAASWQRRLSKRSSLRLAAGTNSVEYPNGLQDDYDKHYAMLSYTAEARNLRYTLLAGMNQATFEDGGDDYEAPLFQVNAVYDTGPQKLTLHASQDVTDSSLGNGNDGEVSPLAGNDGVGIDQMERRKVALTWDTQSLCARCDLSSYVQYRQDEYRRDKEDDNSEISAGITLRYRLTAQASADIRYLLQDQTYVDDNRPGFMRDQLNLSFEYDFSNALSGSLFYRFESTRGDVGSSEYEQNNFGVSAKYSI